MMGYVVMMGGEWGKEFREDDWSMDLSRGMLLQYDRSPWMADTQFSTALSISTFD